MKPHEILKTFPGSQTGRDNDVFVAGTTRDLSRDLSDIAVAQGWARPVGAVNRASNRQTKVVEPSETKAPEADESTSESASTTQKSQAEESEARKSFKLGLPKGNNKKA